MEPTLKQAVYMLLSEINQLDDLEKEYSDESMVEEVIYYLASISSTCPFKNYAMEDLCPIAKMGSFDCDEYQSNYIGQYLNISCIDHEENETAFIWEDFIKVAIGNKEN